MEKTYNPQAIEQQWYKTWENAGYFIPSGQGKAYCIMLPPPNVTGTLHMGHGFQHTLMDALIRYHRMSGDNTLWQGGTDHAGIATQIVVERQLELEGKSRHDLGRIEFEKKVWAWKAESGGQITQQLRRMGSSIDWSRERFTMDDELSYAVRHVFIQLFEEGLIYRGERLVNWDTTLQSALSDLEVVNREEQGKLWHIRYPLVSGDGYLIVATTRPETLLGDVAIAVHPADERYQKLIGQKVKLPLTNREIPIIADEFVERNFGSGVVKITPAHDFNDNAVGQKHNLTPINILTKNGLLNRHAGIYEGHSVTSARVMVLNDLTQQNLIEKEEPHTLNVPYSERTGSVIEPFLTEQWFVKMQDLAQPAINAVEKGDLKFIPENWTKTYLQWLNNIQDWCISRQLWWGHRIPVWYDDLNHKTYVGHSEDEIRKKNNLTTAINLRQDEDVLDTWFSAGLWPFATLGWPNKTPEFNTFYPTNVLVTGFDIIFFWVSRMVMMGLKFTGEVPFKEVYIHGLIRDAYGQKMSKSKGNVLDPIDLIDGITLDKLIAKRTSGLINPKMSQQITKDTKKEYPDGIPAFGTDALRFTFCALATTGRDIRFDLGRVEGNRNFCNKLWNAARFVLMNTESHAADLSNNEFELSLADQWIISRLQNTIKKVNEYFSQYRFDLLAQEIYEFTWNNYCDWYLELAKLVLNNPSATDKQLRGTRITLVSALETLLRLMHPLMPFITEEIWQRIKSVSGKTGGTIQKEAYPVTDESKINQEMENEIAWLQQFIICIRNIRGEMNVAPGKLIPLLIADGTDNDKSLLLKHRSLIQQFAKLESITILKTDEKIPPTASAMLGKLRILIPLAGLIDVAAETARLQKEIAKLNTELERSQAKLANENYVAKAPAEVVAKEKSRVAEIQNTLTNYQQQLAQLCKTI